MSIIPSFKMNAIDDVIFQGCLLFLNFSEKCLKLNHMLLLSFNTQYTLGIVHSGTNTRRGLRQVTSSGRIHFGHVLLASSEASSTSPKWIRPKLVTCRRPLRVFVPECTYPEMYNCTQHIGPKNKQIMEFKTPLDKNVQIYRQYKSWKESIIYRIHL